MADGLFFLIQTSNFPRNLFFPCLEVIQSLFQRLQSNNDNNSNNNEEKQCTGGSCDSCGVAREKMQCDGTGRIQGGLAAIPLFSWWPIKAYRPCPGLIESGGTYTRKGQDVDSILWGENGRDQTTTKVLIMCILLSTYSMTNCYSYSYSYRICAPPLVITR